MQTIAAKFFLGLPGLFILATGIVFLTNPDAAAAKLLLDPQGAEGLSNLRGMLGAPIFAVGASLLLSAITEKLEYARPAVFFLFALIAGRLLSYFIDGSAQPIALFLTVPSVTFGLMVVGHVLLVRGESTEGQAATA